MAIYHLSLKEMRRSQGRSSVAAAAYRLGEKMKDERIGKTFNYSKKSGNYNIYITGHSLGGYLAQIGGAYIEENIVDVDSVVNYSLHETGYDIVYDVEYDNGIVNVYLFDEYKLYRIITIIYLCNIILFAK